MNATNIAVISLAFSIAGIILSIIGIAVSLFRLEGNKRIVVFLLSLIILIIASTYVVSVLIHPFVETPDIVGMDVEEAKKELTKYGLLYETSMGYSEDYPIGVIFEQDPMVGGFIQQGKIVVVRVNVTPAEFEAVKIPNLTNHTFEEAKKILNDLGLKIKKQSTENNDSIESGRIINQSPDAEIPVELGSVVNVVISKGPVKPVASNSNVKPQLDVNTKTPEASSGGSTDMGNANMDNSLPLSADLNQSAKQWSEWQTELPDTVRNNQDKYTIESKTQYAGYDVEQIVTDSKQSAEWKLVDTQTIEGEWSEWSKIEPEQKDGRKIQEEKTKELEEWDGSPRVAEDGSIFGVLDDNVVGYYVDVTYYRYRDNFKQYTYTRKGNLSRNWQDGRIEETDACIVEMRDVYRYKLK